MPQFAHFVRKLEEYLHMSVEVLKGLSHFVKYYEFPEKEMLWTSKIVSFLHKY